MHSNIQIPNYGNATTFNVLVVNDRCSPVSWQVHSHDGDPTDAWASVTTEVDRGNDPNDPLRRPVVRAFIYCTATEQSFEFTF